MGGQRYVINRQVPTRQLWWSSPLSGPRRYELREGAWRATRAGSELRADLAEELGRLAPHLPPLRIRDHD